MIRRLLFMWACVLMVAQLHAEERPNIVLILGDDQAWDDYGFLGHDAIQTPKLDAFAAESLVYDKGYVASPLCRPSLATLVTGLFPFDHGIPGNDVKGYKNRETADKPIRDSFHKVPSIIRKLVDSGYLAHQSGKWWEGSYQEGGFTHGMTHGDNARGGRHGDEGLTIGREGMEPITDFIDEAVEKKKPFFVWYAPFLPHTPHNPPERLLNKYKQAGRAMDVAKYYAMCEWFDETCGELLGYIDKKGLKENTLVIYICDNGWAAKSTNAKDPNQRRFGHFALRSKGSPFQAGIRTPIMVRWPRNVNAERATDFAHSIDVVPTIAAAAGVEMPDNLPGIDLTDRDAIAKRKIVFGVVNSVHTMTPGKRDGTLQYLWAIEGDWKLILRYKGLATDKWARVNDWDRVPVRLYNLKDDPKEKTNLAKEKPELVEALTKKIESWHPVTNTARL